MKINKALLIKCIFVVLIIVSGCGGGDGSNSEDHNAPADTTPPVITLIGNSTINLTVGDSYTDAGASANDNEDGDITNSIVKTGTVDTSTAGTYTIKYNVSDSAGNSASEVTRSVVVVVAPVKSLSGTVAIGAPVTNTELIITDSDGKQTTATTDEYGKYSIEDHDFKAPILMEANTGLEEYPKLISVAMQTDDVSTVLNVTPATTAITSTSVSKSTQDVNINDLTVLNKGTLDEQSNIVKSMANEYFVLQEVAPQDIDLFETEFDANGSKIDGVFDLLHFSSENNIIKLSSQIGFPQAITSAEQGALKVSPYDQLTSMGFIIKKLVISNYHKCVLVDSGEVYCWGYNNRGSLGVGYFSNDEIKDPQKVIDLSSVIDISANGSGTTCALASTGKMYCWGLGAHGQLARMPNTDNSHTPIEIVLGSEVTAISVSEGPVCASLTSGSMKCWADNGGIWEVTESELGAKAISSSGGGTHACALLEDKNVRCFGWNNAAGELGDMNIATHSTTRKIASPDLGGEPVTKISVGTYFSCALLEDGSVKCWGDNKYGQLGNGITRDMRAENNPVLPQPTQVLGLGVGTTADIYSAWSHTCAVLADGEIRCWGKNESGQLGATTTEEVTEGIGMDDKIMVSSTPVKVENFSGKGKSITASYSSSCALNNKDKFQCWGVE